MKTCRNAFLMCALMGIGLHFTAVAAPPQQPSPTPSPAPAPSPIPAPAPSADCQDLLAKINAGEDAAETACSADETNAACQSAITSLDDLYKQADAAQCEADGGAGDGDGFRAQ